MASELWQLGLGLAATAAVYPITRAWDNHVDRKRKLGDLTPPPSPQFGNKRLQLTSQSRPNMAISTRMRGRRSRFGRFRRRRRFTTGRSRVKRVLRTAARRRFKTRVRGIVLRTAEPQKQYFTETTFTLAPGNGTTAMNFRVFAPWQAAFNQGTASTQITGSRVFLQKFIWRLHIQGLVAGDTHVQIIFFKSDFMMDVTAAGTDVNNEGTTMGATTDIDSVPTQVPPNSNIPIFDTTTSPGQFSGVSAVTPFNTDIIRIIKKWDFKLHGFGQAATDPFLDTALTLPFNKTVQVQENAGAMDAIPRFFGAIGRRGRNDQYYIGVRTWVQDNDSSTSSISVTHRGKLLWKEV